MKGTILLKVLVLVFLLVGVGVFTYANKQVIYDKFFSPPLDISISPDPYSCETTADCVVMDLPSCCGNFPGCANKNYVPDVQAVQEECIELGITSTCGFSGVTSCECQQGRCRDVTDSRCTLEPDAGICKAYFPRYFFNPSQGVCQEFIWGGCEGTVPFKTMGACEKTCER